MLKILQPHQQPGRLPRTAVVRAVQGTELLVKYRPIQQVGQTVQGMALVEHIVQAFAEQVGGGAAHSVRLSGGHV